jgi:cytochrome c553
MSFHRLLFAAFSFAVLDAAAQSGPPPDPSIKDKVETCVACHGPGGNSTSGAIPVLAGQNARYIYLELRDFKEGRRHDPSKDLIAATLTQADMLALADYFSKQKPTPNGFKADSAKVTAGRKKSDEVLCPMCHQGEFVGQNEIPRVAGQQYEYIKKQLADFKAKRRTNDAGNMTSVAGTLSDADIENLAQYIANLN